MCKCTRIRIMIFMWFHFLWTIHLQIKQLMKLKKECVKPKILEDISEEKYLNNRSFARSKTKMQIILTIYTIMFHFIELYYGFYYKYYMCLIPKKNINNQLLCIYWHFVLNTINIFFNLPVFITNTYVTNDSYKNITIYNIFYEFLRFVTTQFLSLSTSVFVNVLISSVGEYLSILLWCSAMVFTIFFMTIHHFITPFFMKYRIMPNSRLKMDIQQIATRIKFPLNEVYIIESNHEGYKYVEYYGLFKKNLVIYEDVFINDNLRNKDIIALAVHEMGHWYYGHYYKLFLFISLYYFSLCLPIRYIIYSPNFYKALGFESNFKPLFIGLTGAVTYIISPLNEFASFFLNRWKRKFQYDADAFVVKLGFYESLNRALYQLNADDTVCCVYDPVYSCWYMEHPTMQERLFMIDEEKNKLVQNNNIPMTNVM